MGLKPARVQNDGSSRLHRQSTEEHLNQDIGNKDPLTILSQLPSFEEINNVLHVDPLKALKLGRKVAMAVNRASYALAGTACGCARALSADKKKRAAFYGDPFWGEREREHEGKILLHVFMYLYGANNRKHPQYKRASAHSCALRQVCDEGKLAIGDIAQHIASNGGFAGLIEDDDDDENAFDLLPPKEGEGLPTAPVASAAQRPAPTKSSITSECDVLDGSTEDNDDDDKDADGCDDERETFRRPTRKPPKAEELGPRLTLIPRKYLEICIVVETKKERRAELFEAIGKGLLINGTIRPGALIDDQELYAGGGAFVRLALEDFTTQRD